MGLEQSLETTRTGLNETRRALKALRASPLEDLGLLLGLTLNQDDLATAVEYTRELLDPTQQRLPDAMTQSLEAALTAWEKSDFHAAKRHLDCAAVAALDLGYL